MRYLLNLLACCSGLLAQSPLLDPASWVWAGRDSDLTFEWHCESTTAEYSVGATTVTPNASCVLTNSPVFDGAFSMSSPVGNAYAVITLTGAEVSTNSGTIDLRLYATTNDVGANVITVFGNSTNYVCVEMRSGPALRARWRGAGGDQYTTDASTYSVGEWVRVRLRWQQSSPYLSIQVNDNSATEYTTGALDTWNTSPQTIRFGEYESEPSSFAIDNVRIYSAVK